MSAGGRNSHRSKRCLEALCEFVRVHFDKLLDRYYLEGHDSLNEFPAWAFERYLRR
jgi:hypothetical protein